MMALERQRRIVELVNEQGSIRVTEISRLFEVTPETARRDLDTLEAENKLKRSHGGAVRVESDATDASGSLDEPYLKRESTRSVEKTLIAKKAVALVRPGDRIALDASSSAWFVARELPDIPLTVLTNSIRVMAELVNRDKVEVIATGGILRKSSMSFVGPLAEETLAKYHVHKAILSCKGVHPIYGVSEANELQALVKRKMVAIADTAILLADESKLGERDFTYLFPLTDVDVLITNASPDAEALRPFMDAARASHGSRGSGGNGGSHGIGGEVGEVGEVADGSGGGAHGGGSGSGSNRAGKDADKDAGDGAGDSGRGDGAVVDGRGPGGLRGLEIVTT